VSSVTMQAVRFHDYGGPEMLVLEQVARPQPQADQVLIRVLAAGVNPADWQMRAGLYKEFAPLPLPWTPGLEASGIVEAAGAGVTTLQRGQEVYGLVNGAYAEYAVAPVSDVRPKPGHLTFEQAATVPMGALTAWQALVEDAGVQPGQRVLVHGAAGGVGHFAVQLARWKGAHVIGTASEGNIVFVRSLGAENVIDYGAVPFETVVRDVDVVVDTVGGETLDRSWQILRPGGILVSVAAQVSQEQAEAHGVKAKTSTRAPAEKLSQITELLESKQITPVVGAVFSLAEARQAHELSQTGHGRGRIVLLTA